MLGELNKLTGLDNKISNPEDLERLEAKITTADRDTTAKVTVEGPHAKLLIDVCKLGNLPVMGGDAIVPKGTPGKFAGVTSNCDAKEIAEEIKDKTRSLLNFDIEFEDAE